MLESIQIKGFESHDYTEISFSEGITYISGDSHCGKSGIMRALRWVCLNEAEGYSFMPHDAKRGHVTEVTLIVDGHEITRKRSRSENTYVMDGEEYKAFGDSVPFPIAKVLDLSALVSQAQLDGHFGLSYTGGDNARLINSVISLDSIDKAIAYVRTVKTKTDADVREAETRVNDFTKRVGVLEPWKGLSDLYKKTDPPDAATLDALIAAINRIVANPSPVEIETIELPEHPPEPQSSLKRLIGALESIRQPIFLTSVDFPDVPIINKHLSGKLTELYGTEVIDLQCVFWPIAPDRKDVVAIESVLGKLSNVNVVDIQPMTDISKPSNVLMIEIFDKIERVKQLSILVEQDEKRRSSAWQRIDSYIKQHPVCPNCGAEQKHWAIDKEVTHA